MGILIIPCGNSRINIIFTYVKSLSTADYRHNIRSCLRILILHCPCYKKIFLVPGTIFGNIHHRIINIVTVYIFCITSGYIVFQLRRCTACVRSKRCIKIKAAIISPGRKICTILRIRTYFFRIASVCDVISLYFHCSDGNAVAGTYRTGRSFQFSLVGHIFFLLKNQLKVITIYIHFLIICTAYSSDLTGNLHGLCIYNTDIPSAVHGINIFTICFDNVCLIHILFLCIGIRMIAFFVIGESWIDCFT